MSRDQAATARRSATLSPVVAAEVALALVTVAAIAGLGRLFRDASFFVPLTALGVAGHVLAGVCRRRRVPPVLVAVIAVVVGGLLIVWLFLGGTTVLGVPTPHTVDTADAALRLAWRRFAVVVAPAPVLTGFELVAAVAVWGGIWFADWAAFRLWAAVESLAPAAVLFVFGSMLGAPRHRVGATIVFAAAALGFMLVHRVARQEGVGTWIATAPGSGRRSLLRAGAALGAIAVLGGALLGPHLPGAHSKAAVPWREGDAGGGSRVTVSPLVDIRKRLVNQSDEEAFSVRATRPAYWRLTSLDSFNGRIWSSGGSFAQASGDLPRNHPANPARRQIKQEFQIGALSAIWVPAAFEASNVDPGDSQMRWDADSSTLIVDDDHTTSDGFNYEVTSDVPQLTRADLSRSGPVRSAAIAHYLSLPDDFNQRAARDAKEVTRSGRNAYERARLLQDWFRTQFTYSLDVAPGHSEDAIEDFLVRKEGYCEQFAGTYAAMARSIGLPSRVAVGFTPGDVDESDPDLYHVKGKHAHAWPEVWFGDAGWVPFEPTPGRGEPGAEAITGVTPPRTTGSERGVTTTAPAPTTTSPAPNSTPNVDPRKQDLEAGNNATAAEPKRSATRNPFVIVVLALLVTLVGYVGFALGLPALRRRRARRRAVSLQDRIALAWNETSEAVAWSGATLPYASETHHEYAARVAPVLGPSADAHRELALVAAASTWSDAAPPDAVVERAESLGTDIRDELGRRARGRRRAASRLDPHRLVKLKQPTAPVRPKGKSRQPTSR